MSCLISKGRKDPCKDNISGIRKMYLSNFKFYKKNQMEVLGNTLVKFPDTTVYEVETAKSFRETFSNDSYNQTLEVQFNALNVISNRYIEQLLNLEFRIIIQTNNGLFKIFGLHNGLTVEGVNLTTSGTKNGFNGYKFSFEGAEEKESLYIDDLKEAGFIKGGKNLYEFQDFIPFLFQDNTIYNFN